MSESFDITIGVPEGQQRPFIAYRWPVSPKHLAVMLMCPLEQLIGLYKSVGFFRSRKIKKAIGTVGTGEGGGAF